MAVTSIKKATTVAGAKYTKKPSLDAAFIREACAGRIRFVHESLGLKIPANHKIHTPSQKSGGKDRFRIFADYDETGGWFDNGGGDPQSGDLFGLPMHVYDWSFIETLKAISDVLGLSEMDANERQRIKLSSKKAQERLQREAIQRTYQANQDCYMLDCVFNLELAIKERSGQRALEPTSNELFRAARLYGALEQSYRGLSL